MILAPLIVGGALLWSAFWLGTKAGPAVNRLRRIGIDPTRYARLEQFVLDLTDPARSSSLDPSRLVVLPDDVLAVACDLRKDIEKDHAKIRADRRRVGY